ncbi:MAG: 1,4-alpha-glucan branching enzyme [Verrucomicrobiales bacterium]|jgi:1,4-alpha-glucan branching enzyme
MLELFNREGILAIPQPQLPFVNAGDHVLAFGRGDFRFIFNFHPQQSFTDYSIPVGGGSFEHVMDTDEPRFGGHARIAAAQEFFSDRGGQIMTYLPSRSAMVLKQKTTNEKS